MQMKGVVILLLLALTALALAEDRKLIAERNINTRLGRWQIMRVAGPAESITFKVLLKQSNLDELESTFWAVSDPKNPNYGKFLTKEQVEQLVAPSSDSVQRVTKWLMNGGVTESSMVVFSDYITVSTSVHIASKLFQTKFSVYKSIKTGINKIRITTTAHIPAILSNDVDFVVGISELIDDTRILPKTAQISVGDDELITPSVLKSYYDVPATQVGSARNNSQGIGAFDDYFSLGALNLFQKTYGTGAANITRIGPDCFPDKCDQYESDLDAQYMTAMGQNIKTLFITNPEGNWILDWAQGIAAMTNPPLVNSISYGWAELEQCEITSACNTYGYNSVQYVTRTDQELQKLGTMGITVLVSDGDDGAPSLGGASGNCPLDPSVYCPTGGCAHTRSSCNEITFTLTSNNTMCFYPMGAGSDACGLVLQDKNVNAAFDAFITANSKCNLAVEQDRTQDPHLYSTCQCSELKSTTHKDITVSPYTFDQKNGAIFAADYPTSSPFVTSVGATQFVWRNNEVTSEIAANILTGAKITTGGGFSAFQLQPNYQIDVVAAYLKSGVGLPPSFGYDASKRGYPDIVFNGHNYNIFASTSTSDLDKCPCSSLPVDGTSCSSPALAGLLSLINDQLLAAGKTPLGFINPVLYQMAKVHPAAFSDITSGTNQCNRSYCCKYGFTAAAGWDPVTGLGSPVFSEMQKYILSIKGM